MNGHDRYDDQRGWRHRLGTLLVVATFGLAILTVLRWLDAAHTVVSAAQAARPVWGLLAVLVLLGSLVVRQRTAVVLSATLVLVHAWLAVPWFFGGDTSPEADDDLVIVASNLEFGEADPTALAGEIRSRQADALVLTEVTPQALHTIQATEIGRQLPNRAGQADLGAAGTVVLSRYPVTQIARGSGTLNQPLVSLATEKGEVLVKAVHPMPPTSPLTWHRELKNLDTALAELVATDPRPVVVAGDFNATEDHTVFRPLTRTLVDAHQAAGAGWVRTWPRESAIPAFAHLDHVLTHGLGVVDAGSFTLPGTDHSAVWARLSLPEQAAPAPAEEAS